MHMHTYIYLCIHIYIHIYIRIYTTHSNPTHLPVLAHGDILLGHAGLVQPVCFDGTLRCPHDGNVDG